MIIQKISNTLRQVIFNLKFLLKNKFIYFMFISFYTISLLLAIIFIPFQYSIGIQETITMAIPTLLISGSLSYNWRVSTLYLNQEMTSQRNKNYYISLLLTLIVFMIPTGLIYYFLIWIIGNYPLFLRDFPWGKNIHFSHNVNPLQFLGIKLIFYTMTITILLSFSLYFAVYRIFKSNKSFNIFIMILLILSIFFSCAFNNYFHFNYIKDPVEGNIPYAWFGRWFYPNPFFYVSFLYPFYSISQFLVLSSERGLENYTQCFNMFFHLPFANASDIWKWDLVIFDPYIMCFTFFLIGYLFSKYHS